MRILKIGVNYKIFAAAIFFLSQIREDHFLRFLHVCNVHLAEVKQSLCSHTLLYRAGRMNSMHFLTIQMVWILSVSDHDYSPVIEILSAQEKIS